MKNSQVSKLCINCNIITWAFREKVINLYNRYDFCQQYIYSIKKNMNQARKKFAFAFVLVKKISKFFK